MDTSLDTENYRYILIPIPLENCIVVRDIIEVKENGEFGMYPYRFFDTKSNYHVINPQEDPFVLLAVNMRMSKRDRLNFIRHSIAEIYLFLQSNSIRIRTLTFPVYNNEREEIIYKFNNFLN